jgi:multiple sugar transport system substrate-binding protein
MSGDRLLDTPLSRRSALTLDLAATVGMPLMSACGGFGISGGGGDSLTFLSTQFTPVEEGERFRSILEAR